MALSSNWAMARHYNDSVDPAKPAAAGEGYLKKAPGCPANGSYTVGVLVQIHHATTPLQHGLRSTFYSSLIGWKGYPFHPFFINNRGVNFFFWRLHVKTRFRSGFTLTEIMIVIAVIGIVLAIAAPTWLRQREISRAAACQENLAKIDGAVEQYAIEFKLSGGAPLVYPTDLLAPGGSGTGTGYLRNVPECHAGGTYTMNVVGEIPTCSIGANNDPYAAHVIQH